MKTGYRHRSYLLRRSCYLMIWLIFFEEVLSNTIFSSQNDMLRAGVVNRVRYFTCLRRCSSTSRIAVQQCRNASALQLSAAVPEFEVTNEPILDYLPGSPERQQLEAALNKWKDATTDVPIIIGGKEYRTDVVRTHTAVSNKVVPNRFSLMAHKWYWFSLSNFHLEPQL